MAVALMAISSAAVIVRGLADVEPLTVAFWRTLGVAVILFLMARSAKRSA